MTTEAILLIDGHSLLFRAHFAFIRAPLKNSKGEDTSAIFGFVNMVLPLMQQMDPRYMVVAFDESDKTFRTELYPDYKGHRKECPPEIIHQTPLTREFMEALGVSVVSSPTHEADDLIGTLSKRYAAEGRPVTIVTGDRDALQLVDGRIRVMLTKSGIREHVLYVTPADVARDMGVPSDKIPDLKGLQGDSSDNIPGVPGVGPKTAVKLLTEHGDLDGVYRDLETMKAGGLKDKLAANKELAYLSKLLGTIVLDAPVDMDLERMARREPDKQKLRAFTDRWELNRVAQMLALDGPAPAPAGPPADFRLVQDEEALAAMLAELKDEPRLGLDTETTGLDPLQATLVGLSLSAGKGKAWYVPLAHRDEPRQLPWPRVRDAITPLVGPGGSASIIGQNVVFDWLVLRKAGLELPRIAFDTLLAAYVVDPSRRHLDLKTMARERIGMQMLTFDQVVPKKSTFADVGVHAALPYAAADALAAFELERVLAPELDTAGVRSLYDTLELPLVPVLGRLQEAGIGIDLAELAAVGKDLEDEMKRQVTRAHDLAKREFNVASPAQLSQVLFTELGFKPVKKTKTGFSTDSDVLAELAAFQECELASVVDRYRHLAKLKGTYVDTLPEAVNPATGRIHSSFHQTVAATGRISSSDPNLQNIPTRSPEGRRIREAFKAAPGKLFVSADYSQIELRIMAHLSGSKVLTAAFEAGADVHRRTAAEVFGVEESAITPAQRDKAKAINFGLIYGQSAHGLATQLLIPRKAAAEYIERYFDRLPEVRAWIEATKEEARERGFVTTILGRRRNIPELKSAKPMERGFAERIAINTPIQGSAADLIKRAMLAVESALAGLDPAARMVLQIHDELIVECLEALAPKVGAMMTRVMEGAMQLRVPLVADTAAGRTWADLK